MKTVFVLFCLTFTCCLSQENSCPSKEDIRPCTCSGGQEQQPHITCNGISSIEQLQKVLKGMEGYKFSMLTIQNSNVDVLPSNLFAEVEIRDLIFAFTTIKSLSEGLNKPPLVGLENSLEYLKISDGFTNDSVPLMRLSLSHLKKLTYLHLSGNILPTIGNDWFESGPYGLRELVLLDTYTDKVGSHAFSSLTELRKLKLTGGHITELKRDMFPEVAKFLESLDFSNNRISSLPNDIFSKMPLLESLHLDNNALITIPEVTYALIWNQLTSVYYFGNPLSCDKDIRWIYKYRLPEILVGTCAAPSLLKGRVLSNLTLIDFP